MTMGRQRWLADADLLLFLCGPCLKAAWLSSQMDSATWSSLMGNGALLGAIALGSSRLSVRWRRSLLGSGALLLSLWLWVDQVHWRAFRDVTTLHELHHAAQLGDFWTSITPYLHFSDLIYFLDLPVWVGLWRGRFPIRPPQRRW